MTLPIQTVQRGHTQRIRLAACLRTRTVICAAVALHVRIAVSASRLNYSKTMRVIRNAVLSAAILMMQGVVVTTRSLKMVRECFFLSNGMTAETV